MNWMKALLPLAAALAVPACSFPCDETGDWRDTLAQVSGPGQMVVSCKSTGQTRTYPVTNEWSLSAPYDLETKKSALEISLHILPDPKGSITPLTVVFDSALADGSYPLSSQEGASSPVTKEGLWGSTYEGTVAFTRTRDLPFIDVEEPEPGEYTSGMDLTIQLQGKSNYDSQMSCPEAMDITFETTTFRLQKRTVVGMCDGGDVLEGLSQIRGGGH